MAALLGTVDEEAVGRAARGRTVVYLAAGRYGGVALLVNGDGSIVADMVDELTIARVEPVATRFAREVVTAGNSPGRNRAIKATCECLGRFVAPELDRLLGADDAAVTIIATGQRAGFPLHAAMETGPGGPTWALNRRATRSRPVH